MCYCEHVIRYCVFIPRDICTLRDIIPMPRCNSANSLWSLRPHCIGLYLNVAKRAATQDAMGNKHSKSSSTSSSNSNNTQRAGKIFLDPNAAPYSTVRGNQPVHIHPSSVLFSNPSGRKLPEYVVFAELLITSKQYMRNVTAVEGSWLMECAPALFKRAV